MRLAISSTLGIIACLLTMGCSPAGSLNTVASTDPSSLASYCSRPDVNATLLGGLRKTPGMEGADFQNITTAAAMAGSYEYFACHGTLVTKNGAGVPGTVTVTRDGNGELKASWLSDADQQKEEKQRAEIERQRPKTLAEQNFAYAQLHRETWTLCLNYKRYASLAMNYKVGNTPVELARDWASQVSYGPGGIAFRGSAETERAINRLIDAAYSGNENYGTTRDEFAERAYSACLHGKPY